MNLYWRSGLLVLKEAKIGAVTASGMLHVQYESVWMIENRRQRMYIITAHLAVTLSQSLNFGKVGLIV